MKLVSDQCHIIEIKSTASQIDQKQRKEQAIHIKYTVMNSVKEKVIT